MSASRFFSHEGGLKAAPGLRFMRSKRLEYVVNFGTVRPTAERWIEGDFEKCTTLIHTFF
jgi:hypothetical protein